MRVLGTVLLISGIVWGQAAVKTPDTPAVQSSMQKSAPSIAAEPAARRVQFHSDSRGIEDSALVEAGYLNKECP